MKPFLLSILFLFLAACAAERRPMPELTALTGSENVTGAKDCAAVYPQGRWQFVHSIDFSMQDGSGGTVIGVTSLAGDEITCVLMTIEGFTLFEAAYLEGKGLAVKRAVPPFDKPAFGEGLMSDVRTIFVAPPGQTMRYGRAADNGPICRYVGSDGRTLDILPATDDCWQIRSYTSDHVMDRSIVGRSCRKMGDSLIPEHLELKGFGQTGYTLKMTLINAENLGAVMK
jgi:hypothetical protein